MSEALLLESNSPSPLMGSPVSRQFLGDSVYDRLQEAILGGTLASGTVLSEVRLATQLGVSRTPVHEAIRRLAADGLVQIGANRKATVSRFSREEIARIYEVRKILEVGACELAAERMSQSEIDSLVAKGDALANVAVGDWPEAALRFDADLHQSIAQSSGNPRLASDILRYRRLVKGFCRVTGTPANLRQAYEEHLVIVRALASRDPDKAGTAMDRHISARLEAVLGELYPD
jgi:DNA-binding GntR family transcriptional regulator